MAKEYCEQAVKRKFTTPDGYLIHRWDSVVKNFAETYADEWWIKWTDEWDADESRFVVFCSFYADQC